MAQVRDPEDLTRSIELFFKANLNTQIGLINAEKAADEITDNDNVIADINDRAWYLSQLPKVWSYGVFIVWGLSRLQPNAQQEDNFVYDIEWFFEVVMPDTGNTDKDTDFYKLLRYTRALSQIVTNNADLIQRGYKFKVESLVPATASVGGKKFRTGGILLSTKMTAR